MMLQEDYQVHVGAFNGPLDLLLFLIRRAEVDVNDIPIAEITEQYLDFLRQLDDIDVDLAGEFLVMAATLIEIKSRTLAPAPVEDTAGEGDGKPAESLDPRAELIRQLLDYQRFRTAAEQLDAQRHGLEQRFPWRPGPLPRNEDLGHDPLELEDVHVLDLSSAYERIMSSIDFTRIGDHRVEFDDTPIALHQEDLMDRLGRADEGRLMLQDVFSGHNRPQRIGLFLATLELVRLRQVLVQQEEIDAPIEIVRREEGEDMVWEDEVSVGTEERDEATMRRSDEGEEGLPAFDRDA